MVMLGVPPVGKDQAGLVTRARGRVRAEGAEAVVAVEAVAPAAGAATGAARNEAPTMTTVTSPPASRRCPILRLPSNDTARTDVAPRLMVPSRLVGRIVGVAGSVHNRWAVVHRRRRPFCQHFPVRPGPDLGLPSRAGSPS